MNGRAGIFVAGILALFLKIKPFFVGIKRARAFIGLIVLAGITPPNWCIAAYLTFVPTITLLENALIVN